MPHKKLSTKAREKLRSYVYLYIDPRDNSVFYVGKGTNNRCFSHLSDNNESHKAARIAELKKLGHEPRIEILRHGLTSDEAHHVESAAIDLLGLHALTNRVTGHHTTAQGRAEINELQTILDARTVDITHPCVLITINRMFTHGMSVHEIYDATRSAWVVNPERHNPELALSLFQGVIREVFEIAAWVPGGTTMKQRDAGGRAEPRLSRYEFVGQVAEPEIRNRYVGKAPGLDIRPGAQNPIRYVNC